MEKQKKVLDASVIFKWFSEEEGSKTALEIMTGHVKGDSKIVIPEFAIIEVLNAMRFKKKTNEVLKANQNLWKLQLDIVSIDKSIMDKAIEISSNNNLTVYDSVYAAISEILSIPLITTDKELYKLPNVIPLDKYN